MANEITSKALAAKWRGKDAWLSDGGSRGAGRLVAKLAQSGATFYFAYVDRRKARRFYLIGPHDDNGERGLTLTTARDRASDLSRLYRGGVTDLHEHFDAQRATEERERKSAEDAERRAAEQAQRSTLRQLLDAYVKHLEGAGKQSADDVRRIFEKHLYKAAPELAARKAAEIPVDDFVTVIGQVVEAGKGRTAAKFRSYLRAAYALAIESKRDPAAPLVLRSFGIESNPIASIGSLAKFNRAREHTLKPEEMGAFLRRLRGMPDSAQKDVVQLLLQLGGQRPAQLLRTKPADVDLTSGTITLYDPKGRRRQPRVHILPLTKPAIAILRRRLQDLADDAKAVFSTNGKAKLRAETMSDYVTEISAAMIKNKESREPFQLRDLRRTAETMMAAKSVSSDVRAQVQSHGLGGVQNRHYDRHDYALEKAKALQQWQRHLDRLAAAERATVTPIRRNATK